MSKAGKETLIKSIAQAIPNYIMSCYKIPTGCCDNIESMLAKFWWGSTEQHRKIHWLSWENLGKSKGRGGIGFRGFEEFNLALLGKQCWRLILNQDSLLARVFKSRYFPRSNFMEAKVGYQPSYAWRSLVKAKKVIDLGARWSIGNGTNVRVWKDNWLPKQTNFKVWSPVSSLGENAMVCELIDADTKSWDRMKVLDNFVNQEAQQILDIPLSWRLPDDKLMWHWEKDGQYSVRSAYHNLKSLNDQNNPESSVTSDQGLWKAIWKLKVPNCVRNFLWRLAKLILLTRGRLEKKSISLDTICPLCYSEKESREHLFMLCPLVQQIWFASPLGLHIPHNVNLLSWLQSWLKSPNIYAAQLFDITLWRIWRGRNNCVFNKQKFCPPLIAAEIAGFTDEFAHSTISETVQGTHLAPPCWCAPDMGSTKINIDAGCFDNGVTAWGLLERDHKGDVIYAATHIENISTSPLVAETLALRWCLNWLISSNHPGLVVIETDSESTVKCLQGKLKIADLDLIISDCTHLLSLIPNVSVAFVSRTKNKAAHGLVKVDVSLGSKSWVGCAPDQIVATVCMDFFYSS